MKKPEEEALYRTNGDPVGQGWNREVNRPRRRFS